MQTATADAPVRNADEVLADEIRAKVKELNSLLSRAADFGLQVDLTRYEKGQFSKPDVAFYSATVLRSI